MAQNPSNVIPDQLIVVEGDAGFVPKSEPSDVGKVLKVDSHGTPVWGEDSGGTPFEPDKGLQLVDGKLSVKTSSNYSGITNNLNGQGIVAISRADNSLTVNNAGVRVTNPLPASTSSDEGSVLTVNSSGNAAWATPSTVTVDQTYDASSTNAQSGTAVASAISGINQVPASTSADEDKVLTVNSSGTPEWATAQGGGGIPALPSIDEAHHHYILTAYKHLLPGNVQVVSADWVAPSFTYFYPATYSDGSGYQIYDWEWYQTLGNSLQIALTTALENFDPWYSTPYAVQARLGVNTSADISLRLPLDCSTSRNISIQTDFEIGGSMDGMSTDITLYKMRGTGFIGNNNDAPVFLSTIHLPIVTDVLYQDITNISFFTTPESGYTVTVPSEGSYDPDIVKHFGIYITLYPNGEMSSRNIV